MDYSVAETLANGSKTSEAGFGRPEARSDAANGNSQ